jgi:hypothetical protein
MLKLTKTLVKDALDNSNDDPRHAVTWLVKKAKSEPNLRAALIDLGAKQVVRDFFSMQRESAMTMAAGRVAANMDNPLVAKRIAARIARVAFWDSYTLFGMQPLKTATRPMLLRSATSRETQAAGEIRMAKFERAIAKKLPNDRKVVGNTLTALEVETIAARHVR